VIDGCVVRGDQRGRELGFPTANMLVARSRLPAEGVFASIVTRADGSLHRSALSVGTRETFYRHGAPVLVEAHLLDFSGDLYGEVLVAELVLWLREQRRFESVSELIDQIELDVVATRRGIDLPAGAARRTPDVMAGGIRRRVAPGQPLRSGVGLVGGHEQGVGQGGGPVAV
jgi:FAD synthase